MRTETIDSALQVEDFMALTSTSAHPKIWGNALVEAAGKDNRISCLTADLTTSTETDLFRDRFPDRFYQVGIAEANMVGVAAGLARAGDIPFLHSFCVFATKRCYDQITMQIAYPQLNAKIVGFMPGLTTALGVSHQAIEDVALMRVIPNMTVLEPASHEQFAGALQTALEIDGPVYLRLKRTYLPELAPFEPQPLAAGKAYVVREGSDGVIFAAGLMVAESLRAAEVLAAEGTNVAVVNVSCIKPLDRELIVRLAARYRLVVTAENHLRVGGLGSAIAETLLEAGVSCVFRRVGIDDKFGHGGTTEYLFDKYGLSTKHIVAAVQDAYRKI